MSYTKKEFVVGDRVIIVNVPNDRLEGANGDVLGKSFVNVLDHYIVLLDKPFPEAKAVCITEACLEKLV